MTARRPPAPVMVLLAALLSGLACSLFRSEPPIQPPTATAAAVTQAVIPATRPADFTVTYEWREGSLPPPYHYEYTIAVAADGTVTLTYIPDYPYLNPDAPVWTETVSLDAAELDALYASVVSDGLFATDWQTENGPPVGGSSDDLTATANGVTVNVPAYVLDDQRADASALAAAMIALIPQATWDQLEAQRQQYIADYSS